MRFMVSVVPLEAPSGEVDVDLDPPFLHSLVARLDFGDHAIAELVEQGLDLFGSLRVRDVVDRAQFFVGGPGDGRFAVLDSCLEQFGEKAPLPSMRCSEPSREQRER